jgi:hypothetical protein
MLKVDSIESMVGLAGPKTDSTSWSRGPAAWGADFAELHDAPQAMAGDRVESNEGPRACTPDSPIQSPGALVMDAAASSPPSSART